MSNVSSHVQLYLAFDVDQISSKLYWSTPALADGADDWRAAQLALPAGGQIGLRIRGSGPAEGSRRFRKFTVQQLCVVTDPETTAADLEQGTAAFAPPSPLGTGGVACLTVPGDYKSYPEPGEKEFGYVQELITPLAIGKQAGHWNWRLMLTVSIERENGAFLRVFQFNVRVGVNPSGSA